MLTKRIIACLDVDDGRVVKGVQFVNLRDAGDPAELAKRHSESGADEIVLLDISAAHQRRATLLDTLRERLHPRLVERVGAMDDGERVAEQRPIGEDVDLGEGEGRAHDTVSSAAARARTPRSIASGATVTNDRRRVFFIASPA